MVCFSVSENNLRRQDYAIKIRRNDCCQQTADPRRQTTRVCKQERLFRLLILNMQQCNLLKIIVSKIMNVLVARLIRVVIKYR